MKRSINRQLIWLASVLFVLMQFFLQLSSGIVIGAIMRDLSLSALMAGLLGSSLYFVYTALQIPVGILFDSKNPRYILTLSALICSIGCILFASSSSLPGLFLGRLAIGFGSAFAFVGYSHILRTTFSPKQFAVLLGLSETLAFIITVAGMISMAGLLSVWGWRNFIYGVGLVGFIIMALCWFYIPNQSRPKTPKLSYLQQFINIIKNKQAWLNGIFVGLSFIIVTVFGALWAIPFTQAKLHCSLKVASIVGSIFFLGAAISCPLFGFLAHHFSRKKLIIWSCLSTGALLLVIMFFPTTSVVSISFLMFTLGICCGAYMLAFSIANELAPKNALSLCTGFTNTLAMLFAPIFQPLIGYLLDVFSNNHQVYTLHSYQMALLPIPIAILIAASIAFKLPDRVY